MLVCLVSSEIQVAGTCIVVYSRDQAVESVEVGQSHVFDAS